MAFTKNRCRFTMNSAAGPVAGTTVRIRYDVAGGGGEIVMAIVP